MIYDFGWIRLAQMKIRYDWMYVKDLCWNYVCAMKLLRIVELGSNSNLNLLCKHKTLNVLNGKSKAWQSLEKKKDEIKKTFQHWRPTELKSTKTLRNRNFCGSENAGKARCSLTLLWLGIQAWKWREILCYHMKNLSTSQQLELHILQWYDLELFSSRSSLKKILERKEK